MNDTFKEFMQKLLDEKEIEAKKTFATNFLRTTDLPESVIAANTQLTLDEVKELAKEVRKAKVAN